MVHLTASQEGPEVRQGAQRYDLASVGLILVFGALYLLTAARLESFGSDTSTYYELARSLRHQHRYWFNFEPHAIYPPGYPLLLAGLMTIGGETFGALIKLSIPVYFVGLLGLYWFVKLQRDARTATVVVLLGAVSTVGYFWATVGLHSDVPYFTVSVWALLFAELARRASSQRGRIVALVLVALCASYLVLVRSVGVTLVAGLLLWMVYPGTIAGAPAETSALERVKMWVPVALLPILVLGAWTWWTGQHGPAAGGDYMQSYAQQLLKGDPHQIDSPTVTLVQLPVRMLQMLGIRTINATRAVLNGPPIYLTWYNPVCLALLVVVGLGFGASLLRERTVLDYYLLSYGGLLLLYPFDEGTRYLFPVQSFIVLYGIDGLQWLRRYGRQLGDKQGGIVAATLGNPSLHLAGRGLLLAAILGLGLYGMLTRARQNLHPDPSRFTNATTVQVAEWVTQNTKPTDVIMDDQYAILHRLTARKTVRFPLFTDPSIITQRILANGADFVVVLKEKPFEYYNPSTMRRFETVRALHPRLFAPVGVFDWGAVYRVDHEASRVPSSGGTS